MGIKSRIGNFAASTCIALLGLAILPSMSLAQQDHAGHGNQNAQSDSQQGGGGGRGGMNRGGGGGGGGGMSHGDNDGGGMSHGDSDGGGGMGRRMRRGMQRMQDMATGGAATTGQSAFAVIRDVVQTLQADPDTDWSQVSIEALRQHLVDMDRITLYSDTEASDIDGGARYIVTGDDDRTVAAIQRMVPNHALQIERELDLDTMTDTRRDGIELTVTSSDPGQVAMIRGIGFMGFMTLGEHHADHHLMMAGGNPDTSGGMMGMGGGGMNHGDMEMDHGDMDHGDMEMDHGDMEMDDDETSNRGGRGRRNSNN